MKRRWLTLLCALLLMFVSAAQAEIQWPALTTEGQQRVHDYVQQINANLSTLGSYPINSVFECYPGIVSLGITGQDNAEISEGVELSFTLQGNTVTALTVRCTNLDLFAPLTASCIQAASPSLGLTDCLEVPASYVKQATSAPDNSFGSDMTDMDWLQGDSLRIYYAYRPNEYHDNANWLQAVLVFPRGAELTPTPTFEPTPTATVYMEESWESDIQSTPAPAIDFQSVPNSYPEGEVEGE